MDYSFDAWEQVPILSAGDQLADTKRSLLKRQRTYCSHSGKNDLSVWVRKDMDPKDFTTTIDYNKTMNEETVSAPVAKGTDLGKVTATIPADTLGYMDGSKEVPTTELITTKAVEKANIFVIGWRSVANFFTNLF